MTLAQSPAAEPGAGELDLGVLSPGRWVLALVVPADEEDEPVTVRVAEDPEKDPTRLFGSDQRHLAEVAPQAELEQATADLLAELGSAYSDSEPLQDLVHRVSERPPLRRSELLPEPAPDRLVSVLVLVELQLVLDHGAGSQHAALSLDVERQGELPGVPASLTQLCYRAALPPPFLQRIPRPWPHPYQA